MKALPNMIHINHQCGPSSRDIKLFFHSYKIHTWTLVVANQVSVLEIWLNWSIHLSFTMLKPTMCFQFSMLNIYHSYGFHLKDRAWSKQVTNQLCMCAWKFRTLQWKSFTNESNLLVWALALCSSVFFGRCLCKSTTQTQRLPLHPLHQHY
jgi:hypothetical protein